MKKVLFICYGNVARSQMAEAFYNEFTKSNDAISAAADKDTAMRFKHPTSDVVTVMLEEGIDVSKKTVKAVDEDTARSSEKIVVMCDLVDCPKYIVTSPKLLHIPVSDPGKVGIDYTRTVRNEIKKMVLGLIHQ